MKDHILQPLISQVTTSFFKSKSVTICFYHVMHAFQSESTLYICLNIKELLAQNRGHIWLWVRVPFQSLKSLKTSNQTIYCINSHAIIFCLMIFAIINGKFNLLIKILPCYHFFCSFRALIVKNDLQKFDISK